jgi:hypothetical protein
MRHVADHRRTDGDGRLRHYLRLARFADDRPVRVWHRSHGAIGATRLVQFLRIARGRLA